MDCPHCGFKFNVLAIAGAENLPDVGPIICESCAAVSLIVHGLVRKASDKELDSIRKSPAWREVLAPVRELILQSKAPPVNREAVTLTDGSPVTPDHREIDPRTGQQKGYVVLSDIERREGFIRPVRRSYVHVGARPEHPTRDLTAEEAERYAGSGYVCFEVYPESEHPRTGRFWTRKQLESGCGGSTTMSLELAETYARDPGFYGGTFCCNCRTHFPVSEFVWEGTDERVGS